MSSPVITIDNNDGQWSIIMKTAMSTRELKFKIDEEFEDKFPMGETFKVS